MNPPLSIIMVNYYSEMDLEKCIRSLQRFEPPLQYELVIVDNGSPKDQLKTVLRQFESSLDVKVIPNPENVGFARACNQGMTMSQGEYVLLLNPDILFVEDSITKMIDFLNHHQEVGVVGLKQISPSGRHYVGDAGYYPTLGRAFNHSFFLSRLFPNFYRGIYLIHDPVPTPIEVDWVSGGCLLVREEVFHRVGGMDESFFLYSEDVEWCSRIKRNGWRIYYFPSTYIVHNTRKDLLRDPYPGLWLKSQVSLYRRDHQEITTRLFSMTMLSGMILRSIVYLFLYLFFKRSEDSTHAKYLFRSFFAYLQ
jgi:GT2 family glycosyltransferase